MSRAGWAFALGFCRRDLGEAQARAVSLAVAAAVALTVAATVVALAVPDVATEVRLRRMAAQPWTRCVWVQPLSSLDPKFTPERLVALEASARARLPAADPGLAVVGFHAVSLDVFDLNRDATGLSPYGRTVAAGDPLLPALPGLVRGGGGWNPAAPAGLLLCPRYLTRLGGDPDAPPAAVRLRAPASKRPIAWPVAGVLKEPLPLGHVFLIGAADYEALRAADGGDPSTDAESEPLPAGWPATWDDFPAPLRKAVREDGVEASVRPTLAGRALHLADRDRSPRTAADWEAKFRAVAAARPTGPALKWSPQGVTRLPPPPPLGPPEWATVYVTRPADLRHAAEAARDADLYANDANRLLVEEVEAAARSARRVVAALVAAFCVAGSVSLTLALYLRGRQKAAQYGMLKALGATDATLRTLAVTEAAALWLAGASLGLAGAAALGASTLAALGVGWDVLGAALAGDWPPLVAGFLALSLVACVVGNAVATRWVRRRPAAESLGLTS